MNAHMFLKERDKEFGENWNDDREQLAAALREYAHLKISGWRESNESLRVLNAEMLEALEDAVACGLIPITSASEGGAARFSEQVKAADKVRAAIAKAKGENVSLVTSEGKSESERSEA